MAKKKIWIILILISISLIIAGTVLVLVKKGGEKRTEKTSKHTPPMPSAKPKEEVWDWTFKWERNDRQWEEAKMAGRKKKGEKYPAKILEQTPNHIKMEYISGYSGKAEEVLLKVGDTGDFWAADYFIKSKNPKEIDLSLKVSLYKDTESPGNFTGIFWQDQDGQQVDCWLSKK